MTAKIWGPAGAYHEYSDADQIHIEEEGLLCVYSGGFFLAEFEDDEWIDYEITGS